MKIGEHTVYASGYSSDTLRALAETPVQAGTFLDAKWNSHRGGALPNSDHVVVIDWTDFGVVDVDKFDGLVNTVVGHLEVDESVDVACLGGHGRTGTLLAGLLIAIEGLDGSEAISTIRSRYCEQAVGGENQPQLIRDYAARRSGESV